MQPLEKGQACRIAVIGAGIVGASGALRLAQRKEARVVIVERSRPGNGTTSASFAWATANEKTPRSYFELNLAGLDEHYRLRDELGGKAGAPWLYPGGNLEWAGEEVGSGGAGRSGRAAALLGLLRRMAESLMGQRVSGAECELPGSATPVAFSPDEAWVDAPRPANVLVERAREEGAELRSGARSEGSRRRTGACRRCVSRVVSVSLATLLSTPRGRRPT